MNALRGLTERQWTVMVYMAGDKYLDNNGFGSNLIDGPADR